MRQELKFKKQAIKLGYPSC